MDVLRRSFKASLLLYFSLFATFTIGLVRALMDAGKVSPYMPTFFLYLHIAFAITAGALSVFLFWLAKDTGLIFPRVLSVVNLAAISTAGAAGLSYLLTGMDAFTTVMLYSFEIAFGVSSMLIGYLYCFYRRCLS